MAEDAGCAGGGNDVRVLLEGGGVKILVYIMETVKVVLCMIYGKNIWVFTIQKRMCAAKLGECRNEYHFHIMNLSSHCSIMDGTPPVYHTALIEPESAHPFRAKHILATL